MYYQSHQLVVTLAIFTVNPMGTSLVSSKGLFIFKRSKAHITLDWFLDATVLTQNVSLSLMSERKSFQAN